MIRVRGEEEWARRIIALALQLPVEIHDDNSKPGMYDLRVGGAEAPERAIEVVGAVDPLWTATWNTGPARLNLQGETRRDWLVTIEAGASIKEIARRLPLVLREYEAAGVTEATREDVWRVRAHDDRRLHDLGIVYVATYGDSGRGSIHFTMEGAGGAVDSEGTSVPSWVGDFLRHPDRADVLRKLHASGAPLRDVFVGVTLTGAPWSVVSYLTRISQRELCLPVEAPDLPPEVTGVWLAATLSFAEALGVRWEHGSWQVFRTRGEGIDADEES